MKAWFLGPNESPFATTRVDAASLLVHLVIARSGVERYFLAAAPCGGYDSLRSRSQGPDGGGHSTVPQGLWFRQKLLPDGWQEEHPSSWPVEALLQEESARTAVPVEGRKVHLRAWRYDVEGVGGFVVPVYFLDSDLPENSEGDRTLTHSLYGGDEHYRLSQEMILSIGGVRMLRALGHGEIHTFHLNEGHAALLTLKLLDESAKRAGRKSVASEDAKGVRSTIGDIISSRKVKPEHRQDDVVDHDVILLWDEERRIITGADVLGGLLRGIVRNPAVDPSGQAANSPQVRRGGDRR